MTEQQATPMHGSRCVWTSKAIDAMKGGKPGDKITREQMAAIIGRDCGVRQLGYGNVKSAINTLEGYPYFLPWVWSRSDQAWVCIGQSSRISVGESRLAGARRRARQSQRMLETIDRKQLDDEDKLKFDRVSIQAEMTRIAASAPMSKRIEASGATKPPDLDAMAKLMQSK